MCFEHPVSSGPKPIGIGPGRSMPILQKDGLPSRQFWDHLRPPPTKPSLPPLSRISLNSQRLPNQWNRQIWFPSSRTCWEDLLALLGLTLA
jgi:hypothetical protein